jgi:anti-sigma regulatory factor (Ser/Thr protein kinase)
MLPAMPESVRVARSFAEEAARRCGLPSPVVDNVRLAVSEAATNAIVHGSTDGGMIRIETRISDGELHVLIGDSRAGSASAADSPGAGLGLPIIERLTTRVASFTDEQGHQVHMTFAHPQADRSS